MKPIQRRLVRCAVALLMAVMTLFPMVTTAYAMTNAEVQSQIISRLYKGAGGHLSCDYDGYVTTSGRHEGIDFACGSGTSIYAVFSGTVVGKGTSSTGVTILAVYNRDYDVTIVYEHANFSVSKGASINVGTRLGTEAANGTQAAHTHFELRTGERTSGASNRNATLENPNPYPYYAKMFGGSINTGHTVDGSYPTPIAAVPRATSGNIQTYDVNGSAENNRWISAGDACTITAVYTDGWMQVSYPSGSTYRTAYAKKSVFFANNGIINGSWSPSSNMTSYKYDNLTESYGSVFSTDKCVVVGQSGSNYQVIYPISSGYKLGWVSTSGGYTPPAPIQGQVNVPGPVAAGIFDGKGVVAMASARIDFGSNEYVSAFDICTLSGISSNTGNCTVTYPSGSTDVFSASRTKDKSVAISRFVEYQPSFAMQKLVTDETFVVYPTPDMDRHGTNWSLDPGDEYYTVARASNGATEVLYYCTRGKHAGWWKLGWVDLPYYWLDLNGWLDGTNCGDLGSHGAADVWVNGNRLAERARDFYSNNGTFPRGSTYEIKNIVASGGYTYNGVHSGSVSGTMKGNVSVALDFTKDPATLVDLRLSQQPSKLEYLEGESLNKAGLKAEAVFSDGSTSNVTTSCVVSGYESSPGVKTVTVAYGGKSTAFSVVVKSKSPTKLSVSSNPTKTNYALNEAISLDGLEVKATYDNGTAQTVDEYEVMIDEGITSSSGKKTITVVYDYNNVVVDTSFVITVSGQSQSNSGGTINSSDRPTLSVVAADQVSPGSTFDVKLNLTNNKGIASLKVKVGFDSDLLELTKVTYAGNMGGMSQRPQKLASPVTLNWFNGSEDYVGDATYATLTFSAIGSSGSLAYIELTYNSNDVYNIAEDNVELNVVNKTIAVGNSFKDGWVDFGGGRKGYRKNGKLVTGWIDIGSSKFYFLPDGTMATGWTDVEVNGKTMHYYFNPASGNLVRGTWFDIEGTKYYFRPSGNAAHGWATISDGGVDKKYYFDDGYRLVTGWREIDTGQGYAARYYFRPSGSMATGWATIDGDKYFFRASGNMATGFTTVDDGFKRYFDESGHMLVGWQVIDGKTFYFRASGAMQTGRATIDGKAYEFTTSGTLKSGNAPALAAQDEGDVVELGGDEEEPATPDLVVQEDGTPVDGETLRGFERGDGPEPDVEVLGDGGTGAIVLGEQ